MPQVLTCPQGHEWEDLFGSGGAVFCPVCGSAVDATSQPRAAPSPSSESAAAISGICDEDGDTSPPPADTAGIGEAAPAPSQPATNILDNPLETTAPAIPVAVAHYDILGELGRGGMGVVYKAKQCNLGRQVALKMMRGGAQADFDDMSRFRAEAEAVARLQHPNIVQIFEVGTHDGSPYFSMELVEGDNLAWHVAEQRPPAAKAAQLVETIARAVHFAHQRGIVHRDLKPGNILIGAGEVPKITDFGLAKRLDDDQSQTRTGAVLGTPSYMAPEQAWGKTHEIGPAVDIYALGAILYELLVGRPPFTAETPLDTLMQVRNEDPVPPIRLQPKLPVDLDTICMKCLQKEPHKRYATAAAFADDLLRFLNGEPIEARPIRAWERAAKWARRRPAVAALIVVSALAAITLLSSSIYFNFALTRRAEEAQRERQRAEDNFRKALQAVDQMLTEVSETQLASEPRMEQKRRALLEKALAFYTEFLDERGRDPTVRKETALAYKRVGDITRMLGQHDRAERSYTQAIDLLQPLAAEYPDTLEFRVFLADSHNFRGEAQRAMGRMMLAQEAYDQGLQIQDELVVAFPARVEFVAGRARIYYNIGLLHRASNKPLEAEASFRKAIDSLTELTTQHPDVPAYQQELARSYLNLGPVQRFARRPGDAQESYRRAEQLLGDLIRRYPNIPDYRHELAVTYNNQGNLFGTIARFAEAVEAHQRALDLFDKLGRDFPSVPAYRYELANTYNSLATVWALTKKPVEATRDWKRSVSLFEGLAAEFPDMADYQGGLGRAYGNLGWLLLDRKECSDARGHLRKAISCLKAALQPNPLNPTHNESLRNAYHNLAESELVLGNHAAAAQAAASLPGVFRDRPLDHVLAAGVLARCATLAEQDAALARQYGDDAVTLLREALRRGYSDRKAIADNPAFLPLKSRPDFKRLVATDN